MSSGSSEVKTLEAWGFVLSMVKDLSEERMRSTSASSGIGVSSMWRRVLLKVAKSEFVFLVISLSASFTGRAISLNALAKSPTVPSGSLFKAGCVAVQRTTLD